jgi:hypothetical protein
VQPRRALGQVGDDRGGLEHLLEVIQDDQHVPAGQPAGQGVQRTFLALHDQAERRGDSVRHPPGVGDRRQVDEGGAVRPMRPAALHYGQGQPGLPDPARAGQDDDAAVSRGQEPDDVLDVAVPADELGHRRGRRQPRAVVISPVGGRFFQADEAVIRLEDAPVHVLKGGPRIDAELLAEHVPHVTERGEGVGLAAGPVQREHQQLGQPLPHRMVGDQALQFARRRLMPAQLDVQRQPLLERGHLQSGQPGPLGLGVAAGKTGQRHPLPQPQRVPQEAGGPGRVAVPRRLGLLGPLQEQVQVELGRPQRQGVAVTRRFDHVLHAAVFRAAQAPAQPRDIGAHRADRGRGRVVRPQRGDQPGQRDLPAVG